MSEAASAQTLVGVAAEPAVPPTDRDGTTLSIRTKLSMIMLLTSMAVLLAAIVAILGYQLATFEEQAIIGLESKAAVIGQNCSAALAFADAADATRILTSFEADSSILGAGVYDQNNKMFASYRRSGGTVIEFPTVAAPGNQPVPSGIAVTRPIIANGEFLGHVYVASSHNRFYQSLKRQIRLFGLLFLVFSGFAYLLSSYLCNVVARPLQTLLQASDRVTKQGDYSARASRQADDEIGQVIEAFNHMLHEIEQRDERISRSNDVLEQAVADKTQEMRVLADRLVRQEQLAAIGQISGSIAHELRNPLGAIKQSVYFLNRRLDQPDEKVQRHLELIDSELEETNRVITNLLDMTRLRPISAEKVDLTAVIEEAVQRCAIPPDVSVHTSIADQPFMVEVDPLQLRQVLINLITNARQSMPEGGRIDVTVESLSDERYTICVADNGCGITEEAKTHVLEPLFTTRSSGTGLGLSLCRQIIETHGGALSLASQVGIGTTISVELPYTLEKNPALSEEGGRS
jgi:signal transduction histidine kinase